MSQPALPHHRLPSGVGEYHELYLWTRMYGTCGSVFSCRHVYLPASAHPLTQFIPGLSPTSWFTSVFPLAFVLLVNMAKEIYDDYHRHQSDNDINSREVLVLHGGGRATPTAWRDVIVGDLVKVRLHRGGGYAQVCVCGGGASTAWRVFSSGIWSRCRV